MTPEDGVIERDLLSGTYACTSTSLSRG